MEQETSFVVVDGVVVPESALLRRERSSRYGSVPGLPDEELADPDELERQVYKEEFGPVLTFPVRRRNWGIRPAVDESGGVDWGAFGTVDFEQSMPRRSKLNAKIAALREEYRNAVIMAGVVKERLPRKPMYRVLKYVSNGLLCMEHIVSEDMKWVVRWQLRANRILREIGRLEKARTERQKREVQRMFA